MRKYEDGIKIIITVTLLLYLHIATQYIFPSRLTTCKIVFTVIFNLFALLTEIYLLLCVSNRGHVDPFMAQRISNPDAIRSRIYCRICEIIKPERTHHCRRCRRCIKRMDHHCPWIATCVNSENHGHFVRFLLFGSLSAFILSLRLFVHLFLMWTGVKEIPSRPMVALLILTLALSLGIFVLLGIFFILQFKNIIRNVTLIELEQCRDIKRMGMNCPPSPYDRGVMENLKEYLGSPYTLFLCGGGSSRIIYGDAESWPPFRIQRNSQNTKVVSDKNHVLIKDNEIINNRKHLAEEEV
ncbi:Palmitoyltransferase PFA4 [Astathelohania contejeani]|uniref:Palmitoyltransferase n=1 Tax=Astathelohania contejeani TaxID=164912 RepID=A0ABQ7I0X5_9MICR|nr:Palmitoyltransferase PFA4 [Thelohania contejeani]